MKNLETFGIITSKESEEIEQTEDKIARLLSMEMKTYYKNEMPKVRKKINEFKKEISPQLGIKYDTRAEKIARAREYPIENIVDVQHDFALCVNHSDTKPSMFCKGNFAHCFSCGWTGDVIDVKMKKDEISFPQAVEELN